MKILTSILFIVVAFFCRSQTVDSLPPLTASKSVSNYSKVIGWKNGRVPNAPNGFNVTKYADGFKNPRWMYTAPNGDVLVAQSNSNYPLWKKIGAWLIGASRSKSFKNSADVITLLRDTDHDGSPDIRQTFLKHELNQPFGMLIMGKWFYVANTDAVLRFPYDTGQLKISGPAERIIDLPAGKANRHWTRNIVSNDDNSKIYIAVGSGSNIAEKGLEKEVLKANILEINPDGTGLRVFASGLRNPVGMDWQPETETLWTAVNERDGLGNNLVPDYLTQVKENGFYGWPYVYYGQNEDPRVSYIKPAKIKETLLPDVNLGPHTASLGLLFYRGETFPEKYRHGAFVAQHGSWNRDKLSGYKVVFIPFKKGKPSGDPEDFLTSFIVDSEKDKVYGRPVGLAMLPDGSLLVTDDVTNTIWRVSAEE
ncbi:sorbosone dehydrogenase family protein [Arenibacter sp. BSSL-BM3]|uniref:Sorbosone dehydrogenase family protein n=1 Tax=Arenibacter arenosicollis TaxID=2762274 RepID=A0ABR7QHX5_9FLAO|nr:sorbosone dehydrogenase family protein [Arenibacter arenosicollis]MBC8766734.1 sorbosone dehydrogenase family protein [Arenibacter arenosicollis]